MRHTLLFAANVLLCGALAAAQPQLLDDATLELDNWRVTLSTFTEKWHTLQPATRPMIFRLKENRTAPDGARQLRYNLQNPGAAPGKLTLSLEPEPKGGAHFRGSAEFSKPSAIKFLCLQGSLPISLYSTAAFEADGKRIPFPKEFQGEVVISRPVKQFRLSTVSGEILLEGDFFLRIQDGRKWNGAGFGIRIGFLPHTGQQVSKTTFDFQIRHGKAGAFGPALGNVYQPPVVAAAGKEWKPFTYHRNVEKNSALDFSGFLDAPAGKYWIYTYACLRSGPSKGARYEIDASVPVAEAANWCMTSQHGYMLYSVGGVLYGYDFRNGRKPVQLLDFSPAEITQIHGDIHTVAEGNSDCVYVCTYEAGTPDSGRIRKYAVADTADRIELQADENTDWTGFQRIRSLWFKEL